MMIRGYEIAGRTIGMIVGALVLLIAVSLLLSQCSKRRNEAVQSRVDASQSNAAATSAGEAINTVARSGEAEKASEDLTRTNERDIRAAEGAGDKVKSGVNDAGLKALCRRHAYRNDPRCKGVAR